MERSTVLIKSLSLTLDAAVIGQLSELHRQKLRRPTWSSGYRKHDRKYLDVCKVIMQLFRVCIFKVEKQQHVFFLHSWPISSCQQHKNIECFISVLLWQIYLVGYNTKYIGLHAKADNLSGFSRVWISRQSSIQETNIKFHWNPPSVSHADKCELVYGHARANWRASWHCEFACYEALLWLLQHWILSWTIVSVA